MSITNFYGHYAAKIAEQGYKVLPIAPGEKYPAVPQTSMIDGKMVTAWGHLSGWQLGEFPVLGDAVCGTMGDSSVGILCGTGDKPVFAVDIDLMDDDQVAMIRRAAVEHLGATPLMRQGQAPKIVMLYRSEQPIQSFSQGKIDIIGAGRQFVAFGRHPSGTDYTWALGQGSPAETSVDELPLVTPEMLDKFFAALAEKHMLKEAGLDFSVRNSEYQSISGRAIQDPDKVRGSEEALREALKHIPNRGGWENWNHVGMALYAASEGAGWGFTLFDEWSRTSPLYGAKNASGKGDTTVDRWGNYKRSPPTRNAGAKAIFKMAQECDGWNENGIRGAYPERVDLTGNLSLIQAKAAAHTEANAPKPITSNVWQQPQAMHAPAAHMPEPLYTAAPPPSNVVHMAPQQVSPSPAPAAILPLQPPAAVAAPIPVAEDVAEQVDVDGLNKPLHRIVAAHEDGDTGSITYTVQVAKEGRVEREIDVPDALMPSKYSSDNPLAMVGSDINSQLRTESSKRLRGIIDRSESYMKFLYTVAHNKDGHATELARLLAAASLAYTDKSPLAMAGVMAMLSSIVAPGVVVTQVDSDQNEVGHGAQLCHLYIGAYAPSGTGKGAVNGVISRALDAVGREFAFVNSPTGVSAIETAVSNNMIGRGPVIFHDEAGKSDKKRETSTLKSEREAEYLKMYTDRKFRTAAKAGTNPQKAFTFEDACATVVWTSTIESYMNEFNEQSARGGMGNRVIVFPYAEDCKAPFASPQFGSLLEAREHIEAVAKRLAAGLVKASPFAAPGGMIAKAQEGTDPVEAYRNQFIASRVDGSEDDKKGTILAYKRIVAPVVIMIPPEVDAFFDMHLRPVEELQRRHDVDFAARVRQNAYRIAALLQRLRNLDTPENRMVSVQDAALACMLSIGSVEVTVGATGNFDAQSEADRHFKRALMFLMRPAHKGKPILWSKVLNKIGGMQLSKQTSELLKGHDQIDWQMLPGGGFKFTYKGP